MTTSETNAFRACLKDMPTNEITQIIRECLNELTKRLRDIHGFPRTIIIHGYLDDGLWPNVLFIGRKHIFNGNVESAHTYKL